MSVMPANWKKVALFFATTFCVTHAVGGAYLLSGGRWGTPNSFVVANALMLVPGVVALVLQRVVYKDLIVRPLGLRPRSWRWSIAAWLFAPLVMLLTLGLSLLLPGARYSADMSGLPPAMEDFRLQVNSIPLPPMLGMLVIGMILGPSLSLVGALGEEIGWRGFLYRELAHFSLLKRSSVTGALWAAWHVPLLLEGYGDRDHPTASALGLIAFALLLAPVLDLWRGQSDSVVPCAILHGTMGATRLVTVAFVTNAGAWANAMLPLVLLAVNAGLLIAHRRGLGRAAVDQLRTTTGAA